MSSESPRDPRRLVLPRGMHYACVQCGRSCRTPWDISVDPASEARLAKVDLEGLRQDSGVGPVLREARTPKADKIFDKTCSSCPFLREDNLCAIHAAHDYETKPQVCQDFPYRYVETGAGTFVGLSFACTAVLRDHGPSVESQRAELEANYPRSLAVRRATHPRPRLNRRRELSWEAYASLEEVLDTILRECRDVPIGLRLVAQAILLDMAQGLFAQLDGGAAAGVKAADSGPEPDLALVQVLRKRFVEGDGLARLITVARRVRGTPTLQRAFIGMTTAFHRTLVVKGGQRLTRAQAVSSIVRHYLGNALGLGAIELGRVDRPFRFEAFRRIAMDFSAGSEADALLTRYFRHCLFRKDLLLGESAWLRQRYLAIFHALVRWHAVGRAAARDADAVSGEDLREALADVEAQYNFHTDFERVFEELPALGPMLEGAARRASFVAAMTGPPV